MIEIKRFTIKIICIVIIPLLFTSCGSVKLRSIDKSLSFNKSTSFAIQVRLDKTFTERELKFKLVNNGYNIISPSAALKAVNSKGDLNQIANYNAETIKEVYSVKDFKSVYILDIEFTTDDIFYDSYKMFYVRVLDPITNEKVMVMQFLGDRPVNGVLNEVVKRIQEKTR